jgi:hypothetical protein
MFLFGVHVKLKALLNTHQTMDIKFPSLLEEGDLGDEVDNLKRGAGGEYIDKS